MKEEGCCEHVSCFRTEQEAVILKYEKEHQESSFFWKASFCQWAPRVYLASSLTFLQFGQHFASKKPLLRTRWLVRQQSIVLAFFRRKHPYHLEGRIWQVLPIHLIVHRPQRPFSGMAGGAHGHHYPLRLLCVLWRLCPSRAAVGTGKDILLVPVPDACTHTRPLPVFPPPPPPEQRRHAEFQRFLPLEVVASAGESLSL